MEIKINISEEDYEDFLDEAKRVGTTPEKIINQFIQNLILGKYSGGSDERRLAHE